MNRINVKALSINKAYRGRRFRTPDYDSYESEVMYKLPREIEFDREEDIELHLLVGLSSKNADLSNTIKCFEDILQKKYSFNDKKVAKIVMEKEMVAKGDEFIEFNITNIII